MMAEPCRIGLQNQTYPGLSHMGQVTPVCVVHNSTLLLDGGQCVIGAIARLDEKLDEILRRLKGGA